MLDFDLAELYEVETKVLNQTVKRNIERFPEDFMFRLSKEEWTNKRSQIVTTSAREYENQDSNRSQFVWWVRNKIISVMELYAIQQKIFEIRGQKVMLDFDLASLYEVETKYLKRAVRQNRKRFPSDFMFELTKEEFESLRV